MKETLRSLLSNLAEKEIRIKQLEEKVISIEGSSASIKNYFECEICQFAASSTAGLKIHIAQVHTNKACSLSPPLSYTSSPLKKHVSVAFECEICEFVASSSTGLKSHIAQIHNNKTCPPLSPPLSHTSSPSKKQITVAPLSAQSLNPIPINSVSETLSTSLPSPQEVPKFKCETCGKPFVDSFMLTNHMRYRHGKWATG